ncbi:hypothetical protein ACH5BF_01220 [Arcobacter sp. YIC-464]|uniref:hypothetical protein n=1 Tax=Arcobacter sp. YIC-464 TaxID=3376631 RepID=UPI003C17D331
MVKSILLVLGTSLVLSGCLGGSDSEEEKWHSFIYPDKQNTKRNMKSPMSFSSLQQCKEESIKQLETMGISNSGTFKCGLNCEFHDGMKLEICEKMLAPTEK